MTPKDLQTVRDWCRANGVRVVNNPKSMAMWAWSAEGDMPEWISERCKFYGATEETVWRELGRVVLPLIQSVRRMDAEPVEGPYFVEPHDKKRGYVIGCSEFGPSTDMYEQPLSEQSARLICNILNREQQ